MHNAQFTIHNVQCIMHNYFSFIFLFWRGRNLSQAQIRCKVTHFSLIGVYKKTRKCTFLSKMRIFMLKIEVVCKKYMLFFLRFLRNARLPFTFICKEFVLSVEDNY